MSKINPYSLTDLKNTTDDALPNYLNSLSFKQSHFHSNIRLLLGYSAVLIGAATFYADYTLGWEKTKGPTLYAVVVYFLLNGAFTWWMWAVERGLVWEGTSKDGAKLELFATSKKHDPTYYVTARWGKEGAMHEKKVQAQFMRWFTKDGFFVAKPFQQWLATEIPVVGSADPKTLESAKKVEDLAGGSSTGLEGNSSTAKGKRRA